jgi:hypothetical protein
MMGRYIQGMYLRGWKVLISLHTNFLILAMIGDFGDVWVCVCVCVSVCVCVRDG